MHVVIERPEKHVESERERVTGKLRGSIKREVNEKSREIGESG